MATALGSPVVQPRLVNDEALAERDPSVMFERLARDPQVDVLKLEKLMDLHERAMARLAQEHFNAAMSDAQTDMRPVAADASNPQTRSKYASYAALDLAVRPIYTKHGFGLSFDTGETTNADMVRVLCYVTHRAGFSRTYHADMPADGKGAKGGDVMTKTHATGAAMSYGMRYLLKMIFNVAVGEDDRDGNDEPQTLNNAPAGFDDWLSDMDTHTDAGFEALTKAWGLSKPSYRSFIRVETWEAMKKKAKAADKRRAEQADV